jgi:hypothetical protein
MKINNPFDDLEFDSNSDNKNEEELDVEDLTIESLVANLASKASEMKKEVEDKSIQEALEELKYELEETKKRDKAINEKQTRKNQKRNEARKEARRLLKAEKLTNAMEVIRPKYEEKVQRIVSLFQSKFGAKFTDNQIHQFLMKEEKEYLLMAQPNRYRTFKESVEDHYDLFLNVMLAKLED